MTQSRSGSPAPALLLPPLLEALDAWALDPGPATEGQIGTALVQLAQQLGLTVGRLRIAAPPLPELDLDLGPTSAGAELVLRIAGEAAPVGLVRLSGDSEQALTLARALELAFSASRARSRADRADRQLKALDQAVRGISGVLDLDRVLQVIVDRVRELVDAQYAALGIVDEDGQIERFITSGISDEERRRI